MALMVMINDNDDDVDGASDFHILFAIIFLLTQGS